MINIREKSIVFWDWNGTILNDSGICISAMNKLLSDYNYPEISRETYERYFNFPVSKYYENIGWNFNVHPFEKVGLEFMDHYRKDISGAGLQGSVRETFELLDKSGKDIIKSYPELNRHL